MRPLNIFFATMVAVPALLSSRIVQAQPVILTDYGQVIDCAKVSLIKVDRIGSLNTIVEEDYPYLRNLACLENGYFSASQGLNIKLIQEKYQNNTTLFTVRGLEPNLKVEARYDRDGNLIQAKLVKKNTHIPTSIVQFIFSDDELKEWTIVSNEMVVKDFDPYKTAYKIVVANGKKRKELHFEKQSGCLAYLGQNGIYGL